MAHMQNKVVELISKQPSDRGDIVIQILIPWLRKKSSLLQDMDKAVLTDVLRNCAYQKAFRDDVIISQGEQGDSFYIMLTGKTSVYIAPIKLDDDTDQPVTDTQGQEGKLDNEVDKEYENEDSTDEEEPKEKNPLDRSQYGRFIMHYEGGKSFGEVALMSEDSVRNATIISDEDTDLLVISRELFNRSVKAKQEEEYEERKEFIKNSSFFHNWSPKFKRLLEMSIRKEQYPFGSTIVRQGDPACGLVFILSGQAKVTVNPSHHNAQFPLLMKAEINPISEEIGRNYNKVEKKRERNFTQHQIQIRRKEGYAAAEKRVMSKTVELCCIESRDVIGDIEMVMELEKSTCTVHCTENTTVMVLDVKNYDRLIAKKNMHTIAKLCKSALQKVVCRASTGKGSQVPLLDILTKRLKEKLPSTDGKNMKVNCDKSKSMVMQQLIQFFLKDKVPLIEPFVPNSLYYRMKSEKRAKMIEINEMKQKGQVNKVENRLYEYRPRRKVPRSMKQLKSMRAENDLLRVQMAWDSAPVSHTSMSLRPRTALGIHRETPQPLNSRPNTAGIFHLTECHTTEDEVALSSTREEANGGVTDILEQIDQVQKEKSEARSKVICSAMAVSELNKSSLRNGSGSSTSALTVMEPFDEDYFDWETSEKNLCSLEDRIKQFCSDGSESKPAKVGAQVAPLRRFSIRDEREDDTSFDVKVPKPGGTVFVKSKPCHLPPNTNCHPDGHQHVRRFVVTRDESQDYSSILPRRPKSSRPHRSVSSISETPRRPKTATGARSCISRNSSIIQMQV